MGSRTIMFCIVFLVTAVGCQPVTGQKTQPVPAPTSEQIRQSTESSASRAAMTDQVETPGTVPAHPTSGNSFGNEDGGLWKGEQMPVFVEVTQTTIMGSNSDQDPTFGVGPAIYFYSPENKVLTLHSMVALESKTEVLIGVTSILQTPGQVFEKREIVQFPSAQPASIQIAAFNKNNGSIEFVYKNENFNLSPGESRTFKQVGDGSNTLTVIASISNHGHLVDIQPVSSDGSWR